MRSVVICLASLLPAAVASAQDQAASPAGRDQPVAVETPHLNPEILTWLGKFEREKQKRIDAARKKGASHKTIEKLLEETPEPKPFAKLPIEVGGMGTIGDGRGIIASVVEVVDHDNFVVQLIDTDPRRPESRQIAWVHGFDTRKLTRDGRFTPHEALQATRTTEYPVKAGEKPGSEKQEIVLLEALDLEPYYAMLEKLGEMASDARVVRQPTSRAGRPKTPEEESQALLKLARSLRAANPDNARKRFQEIIDKFPGTDAAKEAMKLLEK